MMHSPARILAVQVLLSFLAPLAIAQARTGPADPDPRGGWIEQLAWRERVDGRPIEGEARAEILREGGAPRLAVLRARIGARTELAWDENEELRSALMEEARTSARRLVLSTPVPTQATPHELAARHLLLYEVDAARPLMAAIEAGDTSPEANLLRLLAAQAEYAISTELAEAHVRTRANLSGMFAALAFDADRSLAEIAASELQLEDQSLYGGDNGSGEPREPYVPPAWVDGSFPPEEVVERLTRRDAPACAALLAEARALPMDLADRDGRALELLTRARAADVLAPEPCFESAHLLNRRRDYARALVEIDAGLRRDPGNARGWAMRAATADALGDVPGTLLSAERALELEPADPSLEVRYIGALVQLGHLGEALAAARDVLAENPGNAWARFAVALDRCDGSQMFGSDVEEDARLVARFLSDSDERACLWAAVTLASVKKSIEGAPRAVLAKIAEVHGAQPLGAAARAVLDDDAATVLWGGFARLARGDRAGALKRWHADATRNGDAAVAARGLVAHFDRRSAWDHMPALPDFVAEDTPEMPDPSAVVQRVPGEARTIETALARLPEGARRVVLARGTHAAPARISRSADLHGLGFDTVVTSATGDGGTIEAEVPRASLRLFELRLDARLTMLDGDIVGRRVDARKPVSHGVYQRETATVSAWYDDVTFRDMVSFAITRAEGRFDRCTWSNPYGSGGTLYVYRARAALRGCTLQQNQSNAAPITVYEKGASVHVEDCRIAGLPNSRGEVRPVVTAANGASARIVRTRIVNLDPVATADVIAEDSRFQRTTNAREAIPGWTAVGRAPEARRHDLPDVRVPGDFPTLAAALASLEPGRTIRLAAGHHRVEAPIARDVVLIGEAMGSTVVQPGAPGSPLEIRGAHVTLSTLRLVGYGLPVYQNGADLDVKFGVSTSTNELPPPIARVFDGGLHFQENVSARDLRGIRFEIGPGGAVTGVIGVWVYSATLDAAVGGDGIFAAAHDLHLRRWVENGTSWSAPDAKVDRGRMHRPLALAVDPRAPEREAELRALRLERLDEVFSQGVASGGTEFLIDALRAIWYLAPEGRRDEEMFARLEPRLASLARSDARRHVEDLIAIAMAGVGDSSTIEAVFGTTRRMVTAFRQNTPEDQRSYVDARLKGMSVAQADVVARKEQCLAALVAGRASEALALAEGLDPLTRAQVLVVTRPDKLRFDEIHALLREGAQGELEKRLRLLQRSMGALRPTGPPPLPGFWQLVHLYNDADRSGVANKYFAFRDKDGPRGWTSETVLRPEYATTPGPDAPRPQQPAPGASAADWDRWYKDLEAWIERP